MPILPDFSTAVFRPGAPIDNPYFPLTEGSVLSYSGSKVDDESGETETESNDVFVSSEKKTIAGIEAFVVRDTAYLDGVLVEDTLDWYAQDTAGNVWYFGEISYNYSFDDDGRYIGTDNDGSWETGVDGALPGWIMPATPAVGDSYFQEFSPGVAVDEALVVSNDEEVSIGLGDFDDVRQTLDTTALEPDVQEFKYYAPGVGQILAEEELDEEGEPELSIELVGIRQTGQGATGEDVDHPDVEDFTSGSPFYVTYLGKDAWFQNALGAYTFDLESGEIGEGRILFDSTEDLEFGDSVAVEVEEGKGLGLFLIPDVEDFALDLSVFEEGGLQFRNILTGETASLGDSLAPLVADEDGTALPIQAFHALGGEDGFNFLNPAAGVQATELDPNCFGLEEDGGGAAVVGFEDLRVTQQGFDGDYNDFLVAVSDEPAEDALDFDDLIVGSDHRDHLRGGREDETLLGFDGNDRLRGRWGDDRLCGDEGKDRLVGGRGDDALLGGEGTDTLRGDRGDDTLAGGEGDDLLTGGRGEDVFSFGFDEGADTIRDFEAGDDRINLSGTALSFDDLTIEAANCGTQIGLGAGSALLTGVKVAEIDESSFIF